MRYIALILFVVVTALLVVLAVANFQQDVSFSLIIWQTRSLPVGLFLLLAFLLGALVLYVVSAASAWQEGRELKRLRQRVVELEQVVANAARIPTGPLSGPAPGSAPAPPPVVPMPGLAPAPPPSAPPPRDISDMPTQH
jgi:uncharacterized integral membrane protein